MPGAFEFYKRISRAAGMKVHFHAPQKKKIARAEIGIAVGCFRGEVEFDPAILTRVVQLGRKETGTVAEMFVRFGDPDLEHDDLIDAASGAYTLLMGPQRSLSAFAAQGAPGTSSHDHAALLASARAVPGARGGSGLGTGEQSSRVVGGGFGGYGGGAGDGRAVPR